MIGNNFTLSARDAWCTVPGNELNITNNEAGKPVRMDFVSNNETVFSQILTYDENGNIIKISCPLPESDNESN